MKKQLLLLFTAILSLNVYSQISFEKGYYINNFDQKIECLIKNVDWLNNPVDFEYKVSENSESINTSIKYVKEFGIYNSSKFIRSTVKIDKSSENISNLSHDRNPVFTEEQLFLKVLVEGKANLYFYETKNLYRFFYNNDNSNIEQLVYKSYQNSNDVKDAIETNNYFKQQLWTDLKCPTIKMNKIEKLEYNKNSLINFFIEYNNCNNSGPINYVKEVKKDLFNLNFRPHLNNSTLSIDDSRSTTINFGNQTNFGFGVEAEFILPFNKNKWAIAIEPNYQSYKSEKSTDVDYVSGGKLVANATYSTIQVPLSLRYYSFINKDSKLFFNVFYSLDFPSKSSIEFNRVDHSNIYSIEFKTQNNLGFGIGYKFIDKYSLEMRYQTSNFVSGQIVHWDCSYKTLSIIVGYTLF